MNDFLNFVETMHANRYETVMRKIIDEKISCALFIPFCPRQYKIDIINQFQKSSLDMKFLISVESADFIQPIPDNVQVVRYNEINSLGKDKPKFVFVIQAPQATVAFEKFQGLGIDMISIEHSGTTNHVYNFYMQHLKEIFEVYNDLIDDMSKKSFLGYMLCKVTKRLSFCYFDKTEQYILDGFIPKPDEIVIDAGVCDGATSAMFADFGCRVIGFEMDSDNYKLASTLAEKKNFTVENFGLGEDNREISYVPDKQNMGGGHVDNARGKIKDPNAPKTNIISLDSYVREKKLSSVDFIKMDTEGAELSILKGSANTIARFKPKFAASAYHKLEDIFTLYQFLKSIRPDYEFAFRHSMTSYENCSFMFPERLIALCRAFGIPLKYPSDTESILFAR